jgi:3-oxoadipate enol-lactonase
VEVAEFLRSALPQVDECTIDGAGHLLHIQRPEPVARALAAFLGRHRIGSEGVPKEIPRTGPAPWAIRT